MQNTKWTSLCLLATLACVDEAELASLETEDLDARTADDELSANADGDGPDLEFEIAEASDPQSLPSPPACEYGDFDFGTTCAIATSKTRITYVPIGNGCHQQVIEYLVNWYNLDYHYNGRIRHGTPYTSVWTTNPVTHSYCSTACYEDGIY